MKCLSCSKGCNLQVQKNEQGEVLVSGGACHRGEIYALEYLALEKNQGDLDFYKGHVPIKNGFMSHLMVTSEKALPKDLFPEIDNAIKDIVLSAPVDKGQVVYEDSCNPLIKILTVRGMKARRE